MFVAVEPTRWSLASLTAIQMIAAYHPWTAISSDMLCQRTPRTREELPPTTYNCTPALDTEEPHNSYTCKH